MYEYQNSLMAGVRLTRDFIFILFLDRMDSRRIAPYYQQLPLFCLYSALILIRLKDWIFKTFAFRFTLKIENSFVIRFFKRKKQVLSL